MVERINYDIVARDRSRAALRSVQNGLRATEGAFSRLTRIVAPLAAIFSAGVLGRRLINTNKEFQKLQASLTTFTGSIERGQRAFGILQAFAAETPFALQEVVASFNILIARGIKPTTAQLRTFGDIASGSGKSFQQFAEAVADAAVGEFERLKEFGIKASKQQDEITLKFGDTTTVVKNDSAAIIAALTEIGKVNFAGATERQAKTLEGAFSNFGDAVDAVMFAVGEAGLSKEINRLTRGLTKFISSNKSAARSISSVMVKALRLMEKALKTVINNLEVISGALAAVFAFAVLRKVLNMARAVVMFTKAVAASAIVTTAIRLAMSKLGVVFIGITAAFGAAVAISDELRAALKEAAGDIDLLGNVTKFADTIFDKFGFTLGTTEAKMQGLEREMGDLEQVFAASTSEVDKAKDAVDLFSRATLNAFGSGAAAGARDYFKGLRDHAGQAKDFVSDAFQSLERTLSDFFVSGELSFKSFTDAVKRGLADIAAKGIVSVAGSFAQGALETVGGSIGRKISSVVFAASGGYISGPGSDRSDNIPAMLSPGEFVVNAASVRKYGAGFFGALNADNRGAVDTDSGLPGFGFGSFISKAFKSVTKVIKKVVGFVAGAFSNTLKGLASGDPLAIASIVSSFVLPGVMSAVSGAVSAANAAVQFGGVMSAQGLGVTASLAGQAASGISSIATGISNGISQSFSKGILGGQFSPTAVAQSLVGGQVANLATSAVSSALTGGTLDNRGTLATALLSSEGETFAKAIVGAFDRVVTSAEPFIDRRAGGGPVHSGRPYLVGERGPEVFTPGRAGSVSPSMNASQIVDAVHEVRDEMATLRRQFGRALSGASLAGARA